MSIFCAHKHCRQMIVIENADCMLFVLLCSSVSDNSGNRSQIFDEENTFVKAVVPGAEWFSTNNSSALQTH